MCFKIFFDTQIIFFTKLTVSNFNCLHFFLSCSIRLFRIIPVFSKFVSKFHKFYLKFCQVSSKISSKLRKDFLYLFSICVFFKCRENLLKILINYLEIEFVNKKIILLVHYPPPNCSFSLLFYVRSFKGPSQEPTYLNIQNNKC